MNVRHRRHHYEARSQDPELELPLTTASLRRRRPHNKAWRILRKWQRKWKTTVLPCLMVTLCWVALQQLLLSSPSRLSPDFSLAIPTSVNASFPEPLGNISSSHPRYGGLDVALLSATAFARHIHPDDASRYESRRVAQLKDIDKHTDPMDLTESLPNGVEHYDDLDWPRLRDCHRPQWSYAVHPVCLSFHELSLGRDDPHVSYLARGHFRTTWLLEQATDAVVLKNMRLDSKEEKFSAYSMKQIQFEAMVLSETSAADQTLDIYGHCATSVFVEKGRPIVQNILPSYDFVNQTDLDKEQVHNVQPRNALTPEEKLKLSIVLTEGLAVMHGHPKGVLVNDDLTLDQWLMGDDGRVKLGDFNNALVLEWNRTSQQYCDFRSRFDYIYRSPEELLYLPTDESSDVLALGEILYSILTGLVPFYERGDKKKAVKASEKGEAPFIDPRYRQRSFIERRLVEIMEKCWAKERQDRISVFELLRHLRETADLYEKESGKRLKSVSLEELARSRPASSRK